MLPFAARAGPPGPAFSFSAFHLPARPLACVDGLVFSHPGSPLSRIRPQLPHTPPTGSVWGFAGVASLLDLQKRTQGHTGASLVFLLQNKFTPPPKGGGAGHRLSWVCWSFPAEKPGAFPQEKTGAAHPRVSLRPSHRLGLAHRAKQAGPGFVLLGAKKPLSGFVGQRLWGL